MPWVKAIAGLCFYWRYANGGNAVEVFKERLSVDVLPNSLDAFFFRSPLRFEIKREVIACAVGELAAEKVVQPVGNDLSREDVNIGRQFSVCQIDK